MNQDTLNSVFVAQLCVTLVNLVGETFSYCNHYCSIITCDPVPLMDMSSTTSTLENNQVRQNWKINHKTSSAHFKLLACCTVVRNNGMQHSNLRVQSHIIQGRNFSIGEENSAAFM